jgi:hypothetical protein
MLLKSWISRMATTYPDLALMVFDSIKESEYAKGADRTYEHSFASPTGAKVIRFDPAQPMGLDPLQTLSYHRLVSGSFKRCLYLGAGPAQRGRFVACGNSSIALGATVAISDSRP